jgi:cobalt-zinc-cadmium resistance protein CzcA
MRLASLLGIEGEVRVSGSPVDLGPLPAVDAHPGLAWYEASTNQALYQIRVEQQALLPDLNVNLFRGTNMAAGSKIYPGFEVGVGIPLFFGAQAARIKAGKMVQQQRALEATNFQSRLESQVLVLQNKVGQQREVLRYFEEEGNRLADQLREQAQRSFAEGEIDFLQYVQLIENARSLEMQFLQAKRDYIVYQLELIYLQPS